MCNACGFGCCAWDGFGGCGCNDCSCPECWTCEICGKAGHDSDMCPDEEVDYDDYCDEQQAPA